jgi:hypothetical protein
LGKHVKFVLATAAIMLSSLAVAPAQSGQAEMSLLETYIGSWKGEGMLVGGQKPEPFRCRLTINKGNLNKVNYAGRCTLIDMNLSVSGTIAYDDKARRYQAAMSSNAGFTGMAVGRMDGDRITFDLAEQETDSGGNAVRIGTHLELIGDSITIDFEVEFNDSGDMLTAKVPFAR